MATSYTTILKLALPATGELSGTWGDVVNQNITSMVEQAIAGLATISTWAGASHTLTVADGTTSESRCAILQLTGSPGAAATVICPDATKIYIVRNDVVGGFAATIKTAAGTGVTIPNGQVAAVFCNGTNVLQATGFFPTVDIDGGTIDGTTIGGASAAAGTFTTATATTGNITTVNATTVDTTNIEVTNLKAKDGTSAGSIADSTGVVTLASSVLTTADINGGTINNATIGATTPSTVASTNLSYTGTLTGGTGVINIGSGQVYKDASGNVMIGGTTPSAKLDVNGGDINLNTFGSGLTYSLGTTNTEMIKMAFVSGVGDTLTVAPAGSSATSALIFKTAVGSTISEAARITSAGNVGIGTSSPNGKLDIVTGTTATAINSNNSVNTGFVVNYASNLTSIGNNFGQPLAFLTNNTERARIDSSGNVGIGTSSPGAKLGVSDGTVTLITSPFAAGLTGYFGTSTNHTLGFLTNNTERARIDASGNLLVGVSTLAAEGGFTLYPTGSGGAPLLVWNRASTTNNTTALSFRNSGSTVGTVVYNNTGTSFNTTSDYRLKEDAQPVLNPIDRLMQLKPINFAWKVDGSRTDGFLAHEAQAVVPEAVTGEKDAVDKDGKPEYQGIDQSKLVPLLTAALQDAIKRIEQLESQINSGV